MMPDEDLPELSAAAEAALRTELAELPRPQIPVDVSDSIRSALQTESAERAAQLNTNVHGLVGRSWKRRIVPIAAAAAVIAVMGFAVWPELNAPQSPQTLAAAASCTINADLESDISPVLHASGASYSPTSLESQAESVAAQPTDYCQAQLSGSRGGAVQDSAGPSAGEPELPSAASDSTPAKPESSLAMQNLFPSGGGERNVRSCVVSALSGRRVEVIDVARFNGRPAIVVVARSPREVLAIECGMKQASVVAQASMSAG
jgi:negative regulator of sigma E activity